MATLGNRVGLRPVPPWGRTALPLLLLLLLLVPAHLRICLKKGMGQVVKGFSLLRLPERHVS